MEATISRYRLEVRFGRYPWKWAYTAKMDGKEYPYFGTLPLASVRDALRRLGATKIVETWK